ncbi:ferrous iron transport protein A [Methanobrevibacter sp. DSM 116169]|uniref:FeoA family protein n=1 Tax=Methanobrevibacter sp. DSM 116169 TaxID=3242727 RepID=UPI0038FC5680
MAVKMLNELKPGDEGKILSYGNKGNAELKRHLLGMGFVKGSTVKVDEVAPLGDPVKYLIKGYSICLRKEEAKNIEVDC